MNFSLSLTFILLARMRELGLPVIRQVTAHSNPSTLAGLRHKLLYLENREASSARNALIVSRRPRKSSQNEKHPFAARRKLA